MATTMEVKVLRVEQGMYLVEWQEEDGLIERYWITEDMIESQVGNLAIAVNPKRGVPYADCLLEGFSLQLSSRSLEKELRSRGIWKYADVPANPNGVIQALQAALGVDLAAILNNSRRQQIRT